MSCVKAVLTLCMLGHFSWLLSSTDIFQHYFFQNIPSRITSECQTGWIQITTRSSLDLGPNCLHLGYQQMTKYVSCQVLMCTFTFYFNLSVLLLDSMDVKNCLSLNLLSMFKAPKSHILAHKIHVAATYTLLLNISIFSLF